jgi:hypothetical protein
MKWVYSWFGVGGGGFEPGVFKVALDELSVDAHVGGPPLFADPVVDDFVLLLGLADDLHTLVIVF